MKRAFKTLSVVLIMLVLVGCAKQNIHMDITNSKVTIAVTDAMNSSLRTEEDVAKMMEEYKTLGYDVKEYSGEEDGMVGIVYSKTYKLSEVSSEEAVEFHLETIGTENFKEPKIFKEEKGFLGNTYRATLIFDTASASLDGYDPEEIEENASSIDISYTVTLPSKAKSHNADLVDGKTYTWKVEYGEKAEINYVFKTTSPIVFLTIGLVAAVIIIVVVYFVVKRAKNNKNNQMMDNANVVPVIPVVENTQVVTEQSNDVNQNMQ